jgi:hypothetical protein
MPNVRVIADFAFCHTNASSAAIRVIGADRHPRGQSLPGGPSGDLIQQIFGRTLREQGY